MPRAAWRRANPRFQTYRGALHVVLKKTLPASTTADVMAIEPATEIWREVKEEMKRIMGAVLALAAAAAMATFASSQSSTVHKVAIHVDQNDPAVMGLALNNVQNIIQYYKEKGEKVDIQLVAYGPGLHMLRNDTSPVKQRVSTMSLEIPELSFLACGNTQANMSKREGKQVPLMSEARVVPAGVVKLIELQQQGYAYVKP